MPIAICKLEQFQSLTTALKPLFSVELHFKPTMIDIHMLNSSGTIWCNLQYKTTITSPCSIPVDVSALTAVKGDVVDVKMDGNALVFKTGNLTYKAPRLADPNVSKRNKESIVVSWPHVIIPLTNADIKDIISMVNNKSKYEFVLSNKVFTLNDITNDAVKFDMPVECEGDHLTRIHGENLIDVLMSVKHFAGCNVVLGSDSPMEFIYSCEWMDVTYLIAPMNRDADA